MTETNKKKFDKTPITIVAAILILAVFLLTNGFGLFNQPEIPEIPLSIGNSPVLGNENAPLVIYEFSDFSCPFCSRAALQEPMPQIITEYVSSGKARLVWKYFPGHGQGVAAQLVGYCVNEQGLFWEFHDIVFQNQQDANNMKKMKELSQVIGADSSSLEQCIKSDKYNLLMEQDINMGKSNGVKGTPTLIINNKKIEGVSSFKRIKKIIDSEL